MDDLSALQKRKPTAARPLLGLTILVVEDSLYACEVLRMMCQHSGARLRRADCIDSARRHLQVYRPTAIIIDLGLPDGSGADLIEELAQAKPRIEVILGTSGDEFAEHVALAAGADAFLEKPMTSLGAFQNTLISCLPPDLQAPGVRVPSQQTLRVDPIAYRDDLEHAANLLKTPIDADTLEYTLQFLTGVARSAEDTSLLQALETVGDSPKEQWLSHPGLVRVNSLVQDRVADAMTV